MYLSAVTDQDLFEKYRMELNSLEEMQMPDTKEFHLELLKKHNGNLDMVDQRVGIFVLA